MAKSKLYKYINILIQVTIGVVAILIIYNKLQDSFNSKATLIILGKVNILYLIFAFFLLFINWGVEAIKWKYAIKKTVQIPFNKAYKFTLTAVTASLVTPNRMGEIPFRALMLGKSYFKDATLKTIVASFSQLTITVLMGLISLMFIKLPLIQDYQVIVFILLLISLVLMIIVLFKTTKISLILNKFRVFKRYKLFNALSDFNYKEIIILLFLSLIRYSIFSFQFYLVFMTFGIELTTINHIMLIPFFFLLTTVIPTILISEIGVRGSVAIYLFSCFLDMEIHVLLAAVTLWVINVGLPALIGIFNLKYLRVVTN